MNNPVTILSIPFAETLGEAPLTSPGERPRKGEETLAETQLMAGPALAEASWLSTTVVLAFGEPASAALDQFPQFNTNDEDEDGAKGESPLPGDALVLEDLFIQTRNINSREDGNSTDNNGPEEELVLPDVVEEWNAGEAISAGVA